MTFRPWHRLPTQGRGTLGQETFLITNSMKITHSNHKYLFFFSAFDPWLDTFYCIKPVVLNAFPIGGFGFPVGLFKVLAPKIPGLKSSIIEVGSNSWKYLIQLIGHQVIIFRIWTYKLYFLGSHFGVTQKKESLEVSFGSFYILYIIIIFFFLILLTVYKRTVGEDGCGVFFPCITLQNTPEFSKPASLWS